jgi:hypothetical protein
MNSILAALAALQLMFGAALYPAARRSPAAAAGAPAAAGPAASGAPSIAAPSSAAAAEGDEADDEEDEGDEGDDAESESAQALPEGASPDLRYTRDLSDAELQRRWLKELPALGSISVGFADQGRLINGVHLDADEDAGWICQRPDLAWGTQETVEGLKAAFLAVRKQFPDSAPARLSHIGLRDGGFLRPHRSHQSGRDADVGFFYKGDAVPGGRGRRERSMDPARNWALVRALLTQADVQVILVDRGIQKVLIKHALSIGEDPDWIDRIFRAGKQSLVQHARRHRDHFHVRFYAPRSQELGRRIQPLLAQRPEQNLIVHRVKRGQTLGHIARIYKTSVVALRKVNGLRKNNLRIGQQLRVPLRGPCTKCPLPPPVVVPERCLPPKTVAAAAMTTGTTRGSRSTP